MLTETELKLINEAMRRYGAEKHVDCKNPEVIAALYPKVISALWVYGTNPAIDLALELRRLQQS
jgi:hypothetical protein